MWGDIPWCWACMWGEGCWNQGPGPLRQSGEPRDLSWALRRRNLIGPIYEAQVMGCRVQRGERDGNVIGMGGQSCGVFH